MDITPSTLQPNLIPITAEDLNIQEGMAIDGTPAANTPATPAADLNIKVSANGSVMSIGNLQSTNFSAGSAGWRLDSNGNIEANDGNFRGDITGATGTFTGTVSIGSLNIPDEVTADSFHVDTTGNAWWGATTIGSAVAKIEKDGSALFASITATGTINAQDGYLSAGVYIDAADGIVCESGGFDVGVSGHIRGGSTDYLTGTGFWLGYDTTAYKFSVGDPAGKYIAWSGTDLTINGYVVETKGAFGGDGSDGAKTVSADENLDADSAAYLVKNYSSLTINATKTLGLTNTNATTGTLVHIKVKGNLVINGAIDLKGDGRGEGAFSLCTQFSKRVYSYPSQSLRFYDVYLKHRGMNGEPGSPAAQLAEGAGGGAGGGGFENGTAGVNGNADQYAGYGGGGAGGLAQQGATTGYDVNFPTKFIIACCGGKGGDGGNSDATPGVGGNGGGGLIIEVFGNVTFGASSEIDLAGDAGTAASGSGSGYGAGGGGGGGGGIGVILYNGTLTDSGLTKTVDGGAGAAGTSGSGAGSVGGDGEIVVVQNKTF